jgi:formate-dependent nitrite reductase membrane component NrfD
LGRCRYFAVERELGLLIISAFFITIYLWSGNYMGPTGKRSVFELIRGRLALVLWAGVILCGILIPIVVSSLSYFVGEVSSHLLIAAVVSEMVGAFTIKYAILKGGLYSPLIPT